MKSLSTFFFILSGIYAGLIQPANYSAVYHTHVLFEWEQIPAADRYQIMVARDQNFADVVINALDETPLYIDQENIEWNTQYYWRIRKHNINGTIGSWSETFTFTTAEQISDVSTMIYDATQLAEGYTIFSSFFNYFSAVIDASGNETWNSGETDLVFYNTDGIGSFLGCYLNTNSENNLPGVEFTFDNDFVWTDPNDEFLHHDLLQLPNGNYMGIVSVTQTGPIPIGSWTPLFQNLGYVADGFTPEFTWVGDRIVEWDKDTKEEVWSWSTFDHYSTQDYDFQGGTWDQAYIDQQYDWTHINALVFDQNSQSVYISSRHLSRITRIDYPSGNIIWNMGHEYSSGDVHFGQDLGFSFQHSLQVLENGNIVTLDNGNLSEIFLGTDNPTTRGLEIAVNFDGSTYTAEILWEYDLPSNLFGFASGNTQKLDNGNYLITTVGGGGKTLEINSAGEVLWQADLNLTLPNGAVYRAMRIPGIYPVAFSVITEELHEYNNEPAVFVGDSTMTFTIHNEGMSTATFQYFSSDEMNWFNSMPDTITLQSNESLSINFSTNNVIDLTVANMISFTVTPINNEHLSKIIAVNGYTFPVSVDPELIPQSFLLKDPFPNPFNPITTIRFSIPVETSRQVGTASLQIFDITGRLVETLVNDKLQAGEHEIVWNAVNNPSGIYFVKLTSGLKTQTKKIALIK